MSSRRTPAQEARKFLAQAFRFDTSECAHIAAPTSPSVALFRLHLGVSDGPILQSATAITLTLYDSGRRCFFGATHRLTIPRSSSSSSPAQGEVVPPPSAVYFWSATDNVLATFEILSERSNDGSEYAVAWGSIFLSVINTVEGIALHPGPANTLLLEKALWPTTPQLTELLPFTCAVQTASPNQKWISALMPNGVCADPQWMGPLVAASEVLPGPFRVQISGVAILGDDATVNFDGSSWSLVAVAHSGFRTVSPSVEVDLDRSGCVVKSRSTGPTMELKFIPLHHSVRLVLALRCRKRFESRPSVVALAVVPLAPSKDRDVRLEGVPWIKGPFSCEDPRMLVLETADPYGRTSLTGTLTVGYYDTPVPAATIEELVDPRTMLPVAPSQVAPPSQQERRASPVLPPSVSAAAAATTTAPPTPALLPVAPAGSDPHHGSSKPHDTHQQQPLSLPPPLSSDQQSTVAAAPLRPSTPSLGPTSPPAPTPVAAAGTAAYAPPPPQIIQLPPQPDLQTYKLLCSIMEELHAVKEAQQRLDARLHATPVEPRPGQPTSQGPRTGPSAQFGGDHVSTLVDPTLSSAQPQENAHYGLVSLAPRRTAVSFATRSLINESLQPLLHPRDGTPLPINGFVGDSPTPLRSSVFALRLEGLTYDPQVLQVPPKVAAMMSFAALPMQTVGVLHVTAVAEEDRWRSMRVTDSRGRGGCYWSEPHFESESQAVHQWKTTGTLYVHLYDAVSMMYLATAPVHLSLLKRDPNALVAIAPLDVPLHVDLSYTERMPPSFTFPVTQSVGQVHLTLVAAGVPNTTPAAAASAGLKPVLKPNEVSRVVAKKLDALDATFAPPVTTGGSDRVGTAPQSPSPSQNGGSVPQTDRLHQMRADYVKRLLLENGSRRLPGVPTTNSHTDYQRQDLELEYRVKYVERKRDELKAAKILECLKERVTQSVQVEAVPGRNELRHVSFESPFTVTTTFTVSIAASSEKRLSIGPGGPLTSAGGSTFSLLPRGTTTIPFIVRLDRNAVVGSTVPLQATVKTARGDLVLVADFQVCVTAPTIDRRYEVFGSAGSDAIRRQFVRSFASADLPAANSAAEFVQRLGALCLYVETDDGATTAKTNAVVDPVTLQMATAWEELEFKTFIPLNDAKRVLVHLYRDEALCNLFETWEMIVFPCQVVHAHAVYFGQTSSISLPVQCKHAFTGDAAVQVTVSALGEVAVKMRPKEIGTLEVLVHALRDGGELEKILLRAHVQYPVPTYEQTIDMTVEEAQVPLIRRLQFRSQSSHNQMYHVVTNYKSLVRVAPGDFALGPQEAQHLTISVNALTLQEGASEGRWPIRLFINDPEDRTVESYLLQVVVRQQRMFF